LGNPKESSASHQKQFLVYRLDTFKKLLQGPSSWDTVFQEVYQSNPFSFYLVDRRGLNKVSPDYSISDNEELVIGKVKGKNEDQIHLSRLHEGNREVVPYAGILFLSGTDSNMNNDTEIYFLSGHESTAEWDTKEKEYNLAQTIGMMNVRGIQWLNPDKGEISSKAKELLGVCPLPLALLISTTEFCLV